MRRLRLLAVLLLLSFFCGSAHALTPMQEAVLFGGPTPSINCNFLSGTTATQAAGTISVGPNCPQITLVRPSTESTATYTDAPGASFITAANNVAAFTPGKGLQIWQAATNYLLNSDAPATQTTGSLGTGSYVFFCNGTGSVVVAAATAVGSGFGTQVCSAGTFLAVTISMAGTVLVTPSGSVNWFDLQGQTFPTPHISTAGATATRVADAAFVTPGSRYNPTSGTAVIVYQSSSTSSNIRFLYEFNSGASLIANYIVGGGTATDWQYSPNIASYTTSFSTGTIYKFGFSWSTSAQEFALNGSSVLPTTSGSVYTPLSNVVLYLGYRHNYFFWANGNISSFKSWTSPLNASQLQGATH